MLPWTKEQEREYMRNYRTSEQYKSYKKKYNLEYYKNPENKKRLKDLQTLWYQKRKIELSKQKREKYLKIKLEIFGLLGNCCTNPYGQHKEPYTDVRCLQIDHVNGGGREQRKQFTPRFFYKTILKEIQSGSKDYQLLCANCNWIKRTENHEDNKTNMDLVA